MSHHITLYLRTTLVRDQTRETTCTTGFTAFSINLSSICNLPFLKVFLADLSSSKHLFGTDFIPFSGSYHIICGAGCNVLS